ncbi:hypothetical protein AVEN_93044-1 [Araneus ventricosus]|uniref:Uncharacterized protein n=1 Tax=Araneus ventricosus TaxID=182803 RepID=A0A4Y2VRV5_ARAVE|nr:hypothetical protein AVEN_93044-1 [Araneus ventricosus]
MGSNPTQPDVMSVAQRVLNASGYWISDLIGLSGWIGCRSRSLFCFGGFGASDAAVPSFLSLSAAEIIRKSSAKAWIAVLAGYCCATASFATRFHSAEPLQGPCGQPLVWDYYIPNNEGVAQQPQIRGCPQGSCSGPAKWNLVAEEALAQQYPANTAIQT